MRDNGYMAASFIRHYLAATRNGHDVHSPFAYHLCEEVFYNKHPFYDFGGLSKIRERLLRDNRVLAIEDLGAGSRSLHSGSRSVRDIARHGISSSRQSEVLYRLIAYLGLKNIVELGTSVGLNTLYLARAARDGKVISIEGSASLSSAARELAEKESLKNISVVHGAFDERLPEVLSTLDHVDLAYIDGNHRAAATIDYFEQLLTKITPRSVIVIDDIHWSREMASAWEQIKNHGIVALTMDSWYTGYVFFSESIHQSTHLRIRL
jgi:predicted O-methyltransferase YrrM